MRVTDKYVLFWTGNEIYSNFYYAPFRHQGQLFKWAEQAIMYRKAKLFGANQVAMEIMRAKNPADCKQLGRSNRIPFDDTIWDENKMQIFKEILLDKFSSGKLKKEILSTGNREFVEASPYDKIWGIGLREDHPHATIKSKWQGQNLLGKVLTEVRDEIASKEVQ